jgi:hypothetical protein
MTMSNAAITSIISQASIVHPFCRGNLLLAVVV